MAKALGKNQFNVMLNLKFGDPGTARQLAGTAMTPKAALGALKRLKNRGLVRYQGCLMRWTSTDIDGPIWWLTDDGCSLMEKI